jgi:hypothetical protein
MCNKVYELLVKSPHTVPQGDEYEKERNARALYDCLSPHHTAIFSVLNIEEPKKRHRSKVFKGAESVSVDIGSLSYKDFRSAINKAH